jgi:hypothetical protein
MPTKYKPYLIFDEGVTFWDSAKSDGAEGGVEMRAISNY